MFGFLTRGLRISKDIILKDVDLSDSAILTPERLFSEFRKTLSDFGWVYGYKALNELRAEKDKSIFLEPTIKFVKQEDQDQIRSWGTSVLELIAGKEGEAAFEFLIGLLKTEKTKERKAKYHYTRFFALRAISNLAKSENERKELRTMLEHMWNDEDEDYLTQAEASILLALQDIGDSKGKQAIVNKLKDMLSKERFKEYWPASRTLRALREFALPILVEDIFAVMENSPYPDHKKAAIQTLGSYGGNLAVVRRLGLVLRTNPDSSQRLAAVLSLAKLKHPEAQEDLVKALHDDDAEIRVQACEALKLLIGAEAVSVVVQQCLREGIEEERLTHLIEAMRHFDPERRLSTEVLSKELVGDDRRRAQVAERILIELGGWAAIQRLSQRRNTLEALDKVLAESEKAVKDTFQDTIRQARRNFYFAMAVNILVVIIGLSLVGVAITQLIQKPEKLESWVIPGAGGVIGVIINMAFNNPRKNAREDLTTLLNVNVIFLGFLRRLNEIDATFKHSYLESHSFGTDDMEKTVEQIDKAVTQALNMATRHLRTTQTGDEVVNQLK